MGRVSRPIDYLAPKEWVSSLAQPIVVLIELPSPWPVRIIEDNRQFSQGFTMHKLTFFPLGNADCCLIDLKGGEKLLFDFANMRDPNDKFDSRCDLAKELRTELAAVDRQHFEVVAFTHLDNDHIKGATEFFWLEHDKKYQSNERIKIEKIWVPAALITEDDLSDEEAKVLQKEARHRFKSGTGIRVFSRPQRLKDWCDKNKVDFDSRTGLITDAGNCAPEFSLDNHGVEFFVHSPFAKRLNECEVEDRNRDSIVMQATFVANGNVTKVLLMGDATHDVLSDIVLITKAKDRESRLEWDVAKLPHHCSYLSLGPDKGTDKTIPVTEVRYLYESKRRQNAIIISTSKPIPAKGTPEDEDQNPPHRQAANYYKEEVVNGLYDRFEVTMANPNTTSPKRLVIEIDDTGAMIRKQAAWAATVVTSRQAPRAG